MTGIPAESDTDCSDSRMYKYSGCQFRNSVHPDTERTDPGTERSEPDTMYSDPGTEYSEPVCPAEQLYPTVRMYPAVQLYLPVYLHARRLPSPAAALRNAGRTLSLPGFPDNI